MVKKLLKKYFESLAFFYSYLRYRIIIVVGFSLLIGILDGFGLTMFLPLLQMVDDTSSGVDPESLGNLKFLVEIIESIGIQLSLITVLLFMTFFFFAKGLIQYISGIYKVNVQHTN